MPAYTFDEFGQGLNYILLEGLENVALNYSIIRGFAHISILDKISNSDKYQRDIDEEHALKIKDYLMSGVNRFLPEVILSLNMNKIPKEYKNIIRIERNKKTLLSSTPHPDSNTQITKIKIHVDENGNVPIFLKNAITRVDGNHRLHFAKEYTEQLSKEFIVSFCIINLNEDQTDNEEFIFYLINNKAKPLMDEENLKVIINNTSAFSDTFLRKEDFSLLLTRFVAKEDTPVFDLIYENFNTKKLSRIHSVATIVTEYITISSYEKEEDIRTEILKVFSNVCTLYKNMDSGDKVQHLEYIVPLITYVYLDFCKEDDIKARKWLGMFIEWLALNNLFNLKSVNYKEIWDIFYQIHQSKSNKVFVSMAINNETKRVYNTIEKVIDKINSNFNLTLELIRIDEFRKGVTYGIPEEILKHIKEGGLLIGDLTYENANVYHEIGYMMGLCHQKGIEEQVILLFNKEANKENPVKFNLSSKRHLKYSSAAELKRELYQELEAYVKKYKIEKSAEK